MPIKVFTLYNQGLKLALDVRISTPTALIYLETRQPYIEAIILKRQLKFWMTLNKDIGTELRTLIDNASNTPYIKHYKMLQEKYQNPKDVFTETNTTFYKKIWDEVQQARQEQSKLCLYRDVYRGDKLPEKSLSLNCNTKFQQLLTRYITSSHDLECEKGKWNRTPKEQRLCKQCNQGEEETIFHFIFDCHKYKDIRDSCSTNFPTNIHDFFKWEGSLLALMKMHSVRK